MCVAALCAAPGAARAQQPNFAAQLLQAAQAAATAPAPTAAGALEAARGGAPGTPNASAQPAGQAATTVDDKRATLVRKFCEGRLGADERDAFALVRDFTPIEQDYCTRAAEPLFQFGYETFAETRTPAVLANGAIPDNYRLGIGDQLVITLRGQVSTTTTSQVDREGRVIIPNLQPMPAVGRTFAEFRRELEARVQSAFVGTEVFVSLGSVRTFGIVVVGEVKSPGIRQVTGLSTLIDALSQAGGVKKTGSLRRITLERAGSVVALDLYDILVGGAIGRDLTLYEGDRVSVTTLGPTIGVAGKVKRPGVYELPAGRGTMTVADALGLAGGALRPQGAHVSLLSFDQLGRPGVREDIPLAYQLGDGDLIEVDFAVRAGGELAALAAAGRPGVSPLATIEVGGNVVLAGTVRAPGTRALYATPTVRSLVGSADNLKPGAYLPFAVLQTLDPATLAPRLFPIDLQRVLAGQQDYYLRDGDRLVVLSAEDVRFLASELVQESLRPQPAAPTVATDATPQRLGQPLATQQGATVAAAPTARVPANNVSPLAAAPNQPEVCRSLDLLRHIVAISGFGRFANSVQLNTATLTPPLPRDTVTRATTGPLADPNAVACPAIFEANPDILPFALEHAVAVNGEVRIPGPYPVTDQTSIAVVVQAAGGVTRQADLAHVEFSRFAGDQVAGIGAVTRSVADLTGAQAATAVVNPGDAVRINAFLTDRDSGPILLTGEFARPGYYDIRRGEHLSDVIARAGGLTAQAYPYGAVFTRERVKVAQQEGFKQAARELSSAVIYASTQGNLAGDALAALQTLTSQIANTTPVGRVVMEADPTVLQVHPELDTVLEPGDTLFIPKRPNSVLVIGDVLSPGAMQFKSGARVEDYVRQAGGFERSADQARIFLVYPNGSAQPLSTSIWNYSPTTIPPGSTIVAPKNPTPLSVFKLTTDITQLVSQIAITAASLAVIGR